MATTLDNQTIIKGKVIPRAALDEINRVKVLTDRIKKRKAAYFNTKPHLTSERSRLVTDSWKETEGMPLVLRRAKLFQKVLEGITVTIWDDELIVGSQTRYLRGLDPPVDYSPHSIISAFESEKITGKDEVSEIEVTDEEKKSLVADAGYWKVKAPGDIVKKLVLQNISEPVEDYINASIFAEAPFTSSNSGAIPDYNTIMERGLNGIRSHIISEIEKVNLAVWGSIQRLEFLQAGLICCDAVINFAKRYSRLARELAGKETDKIRKSELEKIAETCELVPANPPRTFREALQCLWFIHLTCILEVVGGGGETPGRMDQYLFPFYENDVLNGKITRQNAAELFGCLWIKLNEIELMRSPVEKKTVQASQFQDVTIGGVTKDGRDASNELTYLILEVTRQMKVAQPPLYLRCHHGTPEELLLKAVETNRDHGAGMPAFVNDEPSIMRLMATGVPLEDARDFVVAGCVAMFVPGCSTQRPGLITNKNKALELALTNGIDPGTGMRLGPATGNPRDFKSYEDLYTAFIKQVKHELNVSINVCRAAFQVIGEVTSLPYASILLNDCIDKGIGFLQGGLRYPWLRGDLADAGYQNIADSLAVMKKLIFIDKKITMEALLEALKVNFVGKEDIHRQLLSAPKYGNDDDFADDIFNTVSQDIMRLTAGYEIFGKPVFLDRGGGVAHYFGGFKVGATPDGRKAGEPTGDSNLSPVQGRDTKGPTAVFLSASKINHLEHCMGTVFNMKIMPTMVRSKEGMLKLLSLIKTFFDRNGWYIQFNMIDPAVLIDAKKHPENHQELLVRVAGFSAYFVELSPQIQDEIIARTLHSL